MIIEIGSKINKWTVLGFKSENRHKKAEVSCECGTIKTIRLGTLKSGESRSCGCLRNKEASNRLRTHGFSQHPLYQTWYDMIRRCYNSDRDDYKHYGGRGITVCDRWKDSFENFLEDMGESYESGKELDRKDVNGSYCKENCHWVEHRFQVINRRPTGSNFDTKLIEYKGEILCISQWAEKYDLPYKLLIDRLGKLNWSIEKALNTPKLTTMEIKL